MITVAVLLILFTFLIYRWNFIRGLPFSFVVHYGLFAVKLAGAAAFFYIYTYYYSNNLRFKSDLWKYYQDAAAIYDLVGKGNHALFFKVMAGNDKDKDTKTFLQKETEFWYKKFNYGLYNENRTIIRFIVLLMFLTGKNIYALSLISVFLSYLGSAAIFRFFYQVAPDKKYGLLITSFLIPSVVFWTSPLLKEMLAVLFLGFTVYFANKRKWLYASVFFVLLFFTKIYLALALLPALVAYLAAQKVGLVKAYVSVYTLLAIVVIALHLSGSQWSVVTKLSQKQHDFINMAIAENAGSYIDIPPLNNRIMNFVRNLPQAFINSFFRPFLGDYRGIITLPNIIENIGLLIFMIFIFRRFRWPNDKKTANVVLMSLWFSVVVMLIIGYTVPVLGALVRYRSPVLPFLTGGLLLLGGRSFPSFPFFKFPTENKKGD